MLVVETIIDSAGIVAAAAVFVAVADDVGRQYSKTESRYSYCPNNQNVRRSIWTTDADADAAAADVVVVVAVPSIL